MTDVNRLSGVATRATAGDLAVVTLDPISDYARWDEFLRSHADAHLYHHPLWLRVLARSFGYESATLAVEDAERRISGLLPLVLARNRRGGMLVSSLPHTPRAGPLVRKDEALAVLLDAVVELVSGNRGHLVLKVDSSFPDHSAAKFIRVPRDSTYIRALPSQADELRFGDSRNHGAIARGVRKAVREGIEIRAATSVTDVQAWYLLYLEAMRAHAVPPRPLRFFVAAWESLAKLGMMRLLLTERLEFGRRNLLAGSIFFMFNDTVFYAFNGRIESALRLRANDVILWHAIEAAWREGFRLFDFGDVSESQHGLASYKMKWGAVRTPLYRYHHPRPALRDRVLRPESGAHKLARIAWHRLPLRATVLIGELLYR
jgi:Acetyltransferase (GNAT) domain